MEKIEGVGQVETDLMKMEASSAKVGLVKQEGHAVHLSVQPMENEEHSSLVFPKDGRWATELISWQTSWHAPIKARSI